MRTMLVSLGLAAGLGLILCQNAAAYPAAAAAIGQSAAAISPIQHTQYAERHGRRTTTKCYREFVIGRYVCHTYRNW